MFSMSARTSERPACHEKVFSMYVEKTADQPMCASVQFDVGCMKSTTAVHMSESFQDFEADFP